VKLKYEIDDDQKRKIFSDGFKGFIVRVENVMPLNSILEILD
jgi:hypothetical protein